MPTQFESLRQRAAQEKGDPQQRNRLWWENLPMTYQAWDAADRDRLSEEEILGLRRRFLEANPWLQTDFDFDRYKGQSVLEIGCGSGAASCHIALHGGNVLAVDLTRASISLARLQSRLCGVNIRLAQMDAERLALKDASVDHVFSWGVLHHSANTPAAFSEVARVMKNGGSALLMVYNRSSARYWIKGLIWLLLRGRLFMGDSMASVQRHYTDGYYHRHFSASELQGALEGVGFRVKRIAVTHMSKRMIPLIPRWLDELLKEKWGWLLIADVRKIRNEHKLHHSS